MDGQGRLFDRLGKGRVGVRRMGKIGTVSFFRMASAASPMSSEA